jgi:site-specific recombinase XerC
LLIETETDLKAVQKRLGHSQFQTTADLYAHVTKKLSRRTAEKFNKFDPKNNSSTTRQQDVKQATVLPFIKNL